MPPTDTAADLIDKAATHLRHAAITARHRGRDDALSLWSAYAGQLDLAAAGLNPTPVTDTPDAHGDVVEHLDRAVAALEAITPLTGPPDLAMWHWHLAELRRLATQMDTL